MRLFFVYDRGEGRPDPVVSVLFFYFGRDRLLDELIYVAIS